MIDIDNLPEIGGVKIISIGEVLHEVGADDLPYDSEIGRNLLRTWMNIHNFGYFVQLYDDRYLTATKVLRTAEEGHFFGIIIEDLS